MMKTLTEKKTLERLGSAAIGARVHALMMDYAWLLVVNGLH